MHKVRGRGLGLRDRLRHRFLRLRLIDDWLLHDDGRRFPDYLGARRFLEHFHRLLNDINSQGHRATNGMCMGAVLTAPLTIIIVNMHGRGDYRALDEHVWMLHA